MDEPTPRQVLYAAVACGSHLVAGVLILAAGGSGLVSTRATMVWGLAWTVVLIWGARSWRMTARILGASIAFLILWVAATLLTT